MTDRKLIDVAAFKAKLIAERQDLLHDAEVTADERAPVVLDQTSVGRLSRMDALQNQAIQIEAERRREVELARIEAALKRIDAGVYGACVSCGEAIGKKRLEADPATPVCVDCASAH
ncbi:MAG TPA: TraR/DksA family transcriptional regulator [Magnetovibrio sp.]